MRSCSRTHDEVRSPAAELHVGRVRRRALRGVCRYRRRQRESGFDSLWVMDHFYQLPALGGSEQPMLEAYTVLGALAARTSRARLCAAGRRDPRDDHRHGRRGVRGGLHDRH
ncbi:MAG: LLM class flavin-dependent oxidoreductase [Acidimicrobiia bacterium]